MTKTKTSIKQNYRAGEMSGRNAREGGWPPAFTQTAPFVATWHNTPDGVPVEVEVTRYVEGYLAGYAG